VKELDLSEFTGSYRGAGSASLMRFRQFLLRGLEKISGEWNLVALAWNMQRLFALAA